MSYIFLFPVSMIRYSIAGVNEYNILFSGANELNILFPGVSELNILLQGVMKNK